MSDDSSKKEDFKHVVFKINSQNYGVKITTVKDVMTVPNITKVPNAPEFVVGVANLRGVILTIVDGSEIYAGLTTQVGPNTRILVVEDLASGYLIGVMVDDVIGVIEIKADEIMPFDKPTGEQDVVKGIYSTDDNVYILFDEVKMFQGLSPVGEASEA
ncbi:chemotaxis protein CheW [Pseudoalteromonas marina]|uniref:Chemotaxis protein CheW n=1 Tax=Pseudoalteromonas marina TaxID=267375 RepID=A0ABT9FC59_9GAMM|nr:chemotaxis protein CheW [Pseudoalteromonas marina]MDP2564318.1 chemotaxis protein CheW [Pseudoalteromonas marina]